ncbi:MAG TPA: DUF1552 domain-containing protein [Polyangia bacterium]
MNHHRFSRRALLKTLGASAAMLPLLHAEKAKGAMVSGFPKRLVTVAWTNGIIGSTFFPTTSDVTSGQTLQPLAPWKDKILMPMGLDMKVLLDLKRQYDGHFSYPTLLTGTGENKSEGTTGMGPSIDQVISDDIRARGINLTLPALHIGVKSSPGGQPTTWRASGQKNTPETDPVRLFSTLFTSAAMPPMQIDTLRLRRQSVLDYLNKDLTTFSQRLGTDDRTKIQAHMDSVRELEKELQTPTTKPAVSCTGPMVPTGKLDNPGLIKAMFDITSIALICDLTRVATFDLFCDGGGDGNSFPQAGSTRDYHTVAHDQSASVEKTKIDNWLFSQVANLVKQLDDTMEGSGTALDNSVIMTATDMDNGANHYVGNIPFLLIGSCGGYFKTGRVVKYSKIAHNKLLATLCNAMDMNVTSFGAAGYEGTLPELTMA